MAHRSMTSQSKHDTAVRRIARGLKAQGYEVKADVKGYSQPRTFGGYKPDVVAIKGRHRKIIEVETTESVLSARDISQQVAFRRIANHSQNTIFRRDIVKTRK